MKDVIDNYRDLPIGKYLEIVDLCETEMTDVDRKVAIIAILTGKTEDEVLHLPLEDFGKFARKTAFLEEPCPDNLIPPVAKNYPVGGFVLMPVTDIRKITAAQYIDFQTFGEEKEKHLVELLSCFLVPRGCEYCEGYDVADVQAAIREEMSVAQVLALLAFFFKGWVNLIKVTRTSLKKDIRKVKDPKKRTELTERLNRLEASLKDGGGSLM